MQVKLGCDLVDIKRVENLYKKLGDRFLDKFLTPFEKQFLKKKSNGEYLANTIASFYAVKEAASKALGCGISKECEFYDIIIVRDIVGALGVFYSAKTTKIFNLKNNALTEDEILKRFKDIDLDYNDFMQFGYASVSVSHDGGMAMAVVSFIKD